MQHALLAGLVSLALGATAADLPGQRTLTFEDRVKAQEAIERVYYAHQIGASTSFEQAVPRAVLESKVRAYLEETAALAVYWKTPVSDEMLQRELERMATGSRMPERLLELYAALGNDPRLIKECLARATLVGRLTHDFYAFDPTLHAKARATVEATRQLLVTGGLSATAEHPNRTVTRIVSSNGGPLRSLRFQPSVQQLGDDEFKQRRAKLPARVGQPSAIQEDSGAFSFSVLLSESPTELRIATYVVAKTSWDSWWQDARTTLREHTPAAVASSAIGVPRPSAREPAGLSAICPGDDTWEQWTLREVPTPRRSQTAVWTGNVVVVWGGSGAPGVLDTGSRYDPATDTWLTTSTVGAPSPRLLHRAVWTGASMVVWGGRGPSNSYLGDGGRYDPVADAWLPVSLVGAPPERSSFTAIWTGNRMVVWGGTNASGLTQAGGRYDPVNDTWTPTSMVGAPAVRSNHTAVWTGSRMVVWGGFTSTAVATGGQYDPASDTWTPTATTNAPAARSGHTAVWTGNRMIVWGGSGSEIFSTGGRYDPVNDTWTAMSTTNTPSSRTGHAAVWSGTAMIVWGGSLFDPIGGTISYPVDGGRYDPVSDTWAPTSLLGAPSGRSSHSLIWTGHGMIVWGGQWFDNTEDTVHYLDTGARYDPLTDTWTPTSLAGTPRARWDHSAIWTGNVMVIWGGSDSYTDFDTGGRYNPVTDDWAGTSTVNAPAGRYLHSAVWTGNAMLVWGGGNNLNPPDWLDTGGTYDPIADAWAPISTIGAPSKRVGQSTVWTGHEMLVWGGDDGGPYLSTGGRYDPASNSWRPMSTQGAPSGREQASAVWTGRLMLVWGGQADGPTYPSTGGRYDPSADRWTPTSLVGAPAGRSVQSTVWTGQTMVVWGGITSNPDYTSNFFNTGGRYDPDANAWTETSTIGAPSSRGDHVAIWTGREMVLWGGYDGAVLNTGGRYDPVIDAWTATSTSGAPSARTAASAVWDGHEMLVWGGYEITNFFILFDTGGSYRATPGESCNGVDDDCDGAVDEGGNALCDDGNPCTDDVCNGSAGCAFIANQTLCDDDNPCTTADTCAGGTCLGTPLTGTSCDDGNACTTSDTCMAGECAGGPPRTCDDGDACTDDSCDPATGCFVVGPRTCDDGSACTDDSCNPATGCVFTPHGGACNDGNPCTTGETCSSGQCVAPQPPCYDSNPCTDDICNSWGCSWVANSAPCDDGHECTVGDTCINRSCIGTPTYGTSCDDRNACTTGDVCHGYDCYGDYPDCDDGNPCTDDGCNGQVGVCVHVNNDMNYCDDGDLCTLGEACHAGVCGGSTPRDCYACPAGFEQVGALCRRTLNFNADYLFNQSESCDFDGTNRYNDCDGGSYGFIFLGSGSNLIPVEIDLQFISGVSCGTGTSQVSLNGTPIGTFTPRGSCQCFPLRLLVSFPDIDVSAYDPGGINTITITPAGGCEGLTRWSDLGDNYGRLTVTYARHDRQCEAASCASATGDCSFSTLLDGTVCGDACHEAGACLGGTCNAVAIDCNDNNVCTTDSCDPTTGCTYTDNTNACDDGIACTTGDVCSGGSCLGTPGRPPGEVVSVSASKSGAAMVLGWVATGGATSYDVLRGRVRDWPVDSNSATEACLANDLPGTSASDGKIPAPGEGYWYLVRAEDSCGRGIYGWQQSHGVPTAPRVSATCP